MFSARMFLPWRTHMRAGPGAGSDDHRRVFRYWRGVGPGARLPITGNVTGDGDPERPVDLARSHGPCSPRSSNPGARHPMAAGFHGAKRPVRSSRPPTAPQAQPTSSRAGLLRQLSRRTGQALPVASAKAQALSSQRAALVLLVSYTQENTHENRLDCLLRISYTRFDNTRVYRSRFAGRKRKAMMSVITKLLSLALFACLIAPVMSAGPIAPCPTASLAVYVAAGAPCQIGSLEFSGFAYANNYFPDLPGPSASNILVTPSGNPADPGLDFSSAWKVAGAGDGMDSEISYVVMTASGAPTIDEAVLGMTDTVNSMPLSIEYSEFFCLGKVVTGAGQCPTADQLDLVLQGPTSGFRQTSAAFAPVSEMTILNDIFIESQGANGCGTISNGSNNFPTATPEPGTPLLGLTGLLVLWQMARVGAHRRRLRQACDGTIPAR